MNLVESRSEIPELTADVARMFIEKVIVREPVCKDGRKRTRERREIRIFFAYVGEFNVG